jgi:hypothetical protein
MVGDEVVPLPQPICRESCDAFKSTCAPDLKTPEGLQIVNDYNFQLPLCDAETYVQGQVSWDPLKFYEGPDKYITEMMHNPPFPEASATAIFADEVVNVECVVFESEDVDLCAQTLSCPGQYVQACVDSTAQCVMPCPSFMYEDSEVHVQWIAYVLPGLLSLPLNLFLTASLVKMSANSRAKVASGIKHASVLGLVYAFVAVIPVTALYTDVACGCGPDSGITEEGTELCQGEGLACKISRFSVFLLMSIFYWITCIVAKLFAQVVLRWIWHAPAGIYGKVRLSIFRLRHPHCLRYRVCGSRFPTSGTPGRP